METIHPDSLSKSKSNSRKLLMRKNQSLSFIKACTGATTDQIHNASKKQQLSQTQRMGVNKSATRSVLRSDSSVNRTVDAYNLKYTPINFISKSREATPNLIDNLLPKPCAYIESGQRQNKFSIGELRQTDRVKDIGNHYLLETQKKSREIRQNPEQSNSSQENDSTGCNTKRDPSVSEFMHSKSRSELINQNQYLQQEVRRLKELLAAAQSLKKHLTDQNECISSQLETARKEIDELRKSKTQQTSQREKYLQMRLENLRKTLHMSKSELQLLLECELMELKEKYFESQKTISSQIVTINCLKMKLHSSTTESQSPPPKNYDEYAKLKIKHRGTVAQMMELREQITVMRRQYEELQKKCQELQSRKRDCDTSLDFSVIL